MNTRVAFIAGASGAVGRTMVRLASLAPEGRGRAAGSGLAPELGLAIRPHYRRAPEESIADAQVFALDERARLVEALRGASTVVQCIGTIRKRFARGDTYETSDIGTTTQLVEAAKEAGTIDHLVLLSSVGAGTPVGAYLRAKSRAEAIVRASGIPFTIFRPSAFEGEGHRVPPGMALITKLPGLTRARPVRVEALARGLLHSARARAPLSEVLEGEPLFRWLEAAG